MRTNRRSSVPEANSWLQIVGVTPTRDTDRESRFCPRHSPYTLDADVYPDTGVARMPPLSLLHAVGMQVNSVDPDQQIYGMFRFGTMDYSQQWERDTRWRAAWLVCHAGAGPAAVGLYSVVSYGSAADERVWHPRRLARDARTC